jgi:hypothetical protein
LDATTKANAAQAAATAIANAKLNKNAADILNGVISFNPDGAIVVGTIPSGKTVPDDGLYLGSSGLVGRNSGNNTFVIGSDGNAIFRGTVEASVLQSADTDHLFKIDLINKFISISV